MATRFDTVAEGRQPPVPQARFAPSNITADLGLLAGLAGTWEGRGFNLIARPAFHYKTDLYLQLNFTRETLKFEPIGSPIPNRGFGQDDIALFGLTYLQQIQDAGPDGALHIEPGLWVTQPATSFPPEKPPPQGQLVARMGSIPHGNALLAQGIAEHFSGVPVLQAPGSDYNFSRFPSFNSTPFGVPPTASGIVINAAGSSEKLTAPTIPAVPFPQYDLGIPPAPTPLPPALQATFNLNTRTPFDTTPSEAPFANTPENQALVNDPIVFLQRDVDDLAKQGYTFEGTVLNIATQASIQFLTTANSGAAGPKATVTLPQFGGGIQNIPFLNGETITVGGNPEPAENAETALVYATFWLETVRHPQHGHSFQQLQYAQMVVLNFPVFHLLSPGSPAGPPAFVNLGWPHISVATLRKSFG